MNYQTQRSLPIDLMTIDKTSMKFSNNQEDYKQAFLQNYKVYKVKDLPKEKRPHERLQEHGPQELSNRELLAAVLYTGTKREGVMEMASRIIDEYGDNYVIHETDAQKLSKNLKIPLSKATQVIATFSLGKRLFPEKRTRSVCIRNSKDAYQHLKSMGSLNKEHLHGLYLNSRYKLIYEETISVGTVNESLVHPREVFKPAIEHGAVALILAHNHPSQEAVASETDINLTQRLSEAGSLLGITLLDHIIITNHGHISISF